MEEIGQWRNCVHAGERLAHPRLHVTVKNLLMAGSANGGIHVSRLGCHRARGEKVNEPSHGYRPPRFISTAISNPWRAAASAGRSRSASRNSTIAASS